MLIDTHCHLDAAEFAADRLAVIDTARAAGVGAFVVPAVSLATGADVRELARQHADCHPAYGLHPLYLDGVADSMLTQLRHFVATELAGERPPVAIGETGLDHFVPGYDEHRQKEVFLAHLRLAREFDLPVILHVRRAVDEVLACLRRVPVQGGIAHAFNGSAQQAKAFIDLGFCLGFGGAMTYPGSTRIRRLATELPLSSLVLETDAPDIPPCWQSAGRCEPAFLRRYAQVLADLRGLTWQAVGEITATNAKNAISLRG